MDELEKYVKLYAALQGTKVLKTRPEGEKIIFVLESGPKLSMTADELKSAIAEMQKTHEEAGSAAPAAPSLSATGGEAPEPPKKTKGKKK